MKMTTRQNKSFASGAICALSLAIAACLVQSASAGIAFQTQNNDTAIYTFGNPVESGEALAPGLRAFMFERGGKRVVAYWHTFGCAKYALADDAGTVIEAEGLKYFETSLPADAVRAAFAKATVAQIAPAKE